jgi:hypothetical protein
MRFESALELQARIFAAVFDFKPLTAAAEVEGLPAPEALVDPLVLEAGGVASRIPRTGRRRIVADIALGVTDGRQPGDDVKLAVLVQDRRKVRCNLVDDIRSIARDEAEVIYIGRQRPLWTQAETDPLRIGSSISPVTSASAGTLGCFCRGLEDGRDGILSNNHVLAETNAAAPGTAIVQPGRLDGGLAQADVIAELARFVPIRFGGLPNAVDAALAAMVDHGRAVDRNGLYDCSGPTTRLLSLRPAEAVPPTLGMRVQKTGRTTCHTAGRVRAVNVNNFMVDYREAGTARFDGQVLIEMAMNPARPFSRPGDSGSLIVDEAGRPAALLFSGSQSGGAGNLGITGANPISLVIAQLGVELG